MLYEPTSLAAMTTALAAALATYGCDARTVFANAGIDFDDIFKPGARYPMSAIGRLWREARKESGDPCIGLAAARRLKPQALHALGLSWMASRTLKDGFERMSRYSRIANTSLKIHVTEQLGEIHVSPEVSADAYEPEPEAIDAALAFIVTLCRFITDNHFAPLRVHFRHPANEHISQYTEFFRSPVYFSQRLDAVEFDAVSARVPVPAGNEELAEETDRIAERYLATLEPSSVQDRVREILLTQLPSGEVDQSMVARRLNRSVSTLQRQLKQEGASYRQVLDETRRRMALNLVRDGEYSLGQIAYLLGFSDQANFTRAFKRWTGNPPTGFRQTN